ncbi:MAG: CsgG/HfaB family protein [Kiritimatiellae bacterium]|nr:CsgG/HfaB family protein [Kiritimatiellia bacterium]MDD5519953.1 CsgG/HfaB family protein [Kiritimatiellia bacterium]
MKNISIITIIAATSILMSGCAAFRFSVGEKDPTQAETLTDSYDQRDLLNWGNQMAGALMSSPLPGSQNEKPIMVALGIENRTRTHIDTRALSDTITTTLLNNGRFQFVNADVRDKLLREQGYQMQNCTPETRVNIGRQLGARYMLTGSLAEITTESGREVRVSKQRDVYYQLTVNITDLETGLIVTTKQLDRLRRSSRPIIGW